MTSSKSKNKSETEIKKQRNKETKKQNTSSGGYNKLEEVYLILDKNGNVNSGNYYKTDVIAQLFGVTVRRIQQLTQDGVLPTVQTPSGRRYDLVPTIQKYVKYLSDKAYGKKTSNKENELKEQKLEAEIALKQSQGELHRLKTEIVEGKYIDKSEVQFDYRRFFMNFKKFALSIPSRTTGYINGLVDPTQARTIESELNSEISNLLNSFVVAGITPEDVINDK